MEIQAKVWLARDKDGDLYVYPNIPLKDECIWTQDPDINSMLLRYGKFPSVKWEDDEPTEAYITLAEPQPQPKQDIDWEQRRYEIAKEMMPEIYRQGVEALKYGHKVEWDEIVDGAVNFADMLIEKLKGQSK